MLSKREQQQLDEATAALAAALRQAVQDTVTAGGPKAAREAIDQLLETHHHQACPDQLMVGYQLVGWLGNVRDALGDRPQRVDEVLEWIERAVGRRYRARAQYTSGALESEGMESQTMHYADALGVDFLPSLIWLLAGAVARYGDGDVEWLRRLEQAPAT
jgi:hypothetical protein